MQSSQVDRSQRRKLLSLLFFQPPSVSPAILGVGRIVPKVIVLGENMATRQMMTVTLVFDHRVIDGVIAAKFMQRVKQLLEAPEQLAA